ncbi:Inositol hexakisphosphate and diphosphoinositol-pentakisphosphate kinase [Smittium mucronatum]|uniref:Inositol hexakisphosphate and diphosphoinositol-pentakisphosphate kinase n=1 Tax=Smittium mucronatum TaxID=133383 RepID=A0A1R0H6X2_9FUNG|nr:Inositol hexakisphosphate and diphosphoinositol-pentakisphosphate kinase [Smittium mucronatum]
MSNNNKNINIPIPRKSKLGSHFSSSSSMFIEANEEDYALQKSPHFFDFPLKKRSVFTVGICAMERKARSRQMQNILDRLAVYGKYKIIVFGDKTILNEDIENWPRCDFLIAFYSTDFPLEKAYEYSKRYHPYLLNSILLQYLLFDRRIVLGFLNKIGVDTPYRLVAQRDGGPKLFKPTSDFISQKYNLVLTEKLLNSIPNADCKINDSTVLILDYDTIQIDGIKLSKPFVEKPVNAEDHNIYIYYHSSQGGGVRKLFRKVGNKSSKFYPDLCEIRTDGSYIYEEFVDANNSVDVKVYTLGSGYCYSETRKSPVVDGVVRRDSKGKEVRFETFLSPEELKFAKLITKSLRQRVCGFDILRVGDKSVVIDINGWSFVKGNEIYYNRAAEYLNRCFTKHIESSWVSRFVNASEAPIQEPDFESRWILKGYISVCRHADRTPKQKIKQTVRSPQITALLHHYGVFDGKPSKEIVLRDPKDVKLVYDAVVDSISKMPSDSILGNFHSIKSILESKMSMLGTKVQLKPKFFKSSGDIFDVQIVVKWGGEITHAGLLQAQDLAENVKKDLNLLNPDLLSNIKVYTSSERRVKATVNVFFKVIEQGLSMGKNGGTPFKLDIQDTSGPKLSDEMQSLIEENSEMLDDNTLSKDEIEISKTFLKNFFNYHGQISSNPYYNPVDMKLPNSMGDNPREFIKSIGHLLKKLVANMHRNLKLISSSPSILHQLNPDLPINSPQLNNPQADSKQKSQLLKCSYFDWCCNENPTLFFERWEKMLDDFTYESFESVTFEPSKVGELYDSLKFDALHSRHFLEFILSPDISVFMSQISSDNANRLVFNDVQAHGNHNKFEHFSNSYNSTNSFSLNDQTPFDSNGKNYSLSAIEEVSDFSIFKTPLSTESRTNTTNIEFSPSDIANLKGSSEPVKNVIYTKHIPTDVSSPNMELKHSGISAGLANLNITASNKPLPVKKELTIPKVLVDNIPPKIKTFSDSNYMDNTIKPKQKHETSPSFYSLREDSPISNGTFSFNQPDLHELYHKSKVLFDFVTPREYGISCAQKRIIGLQGSSLILQSIIQEIISIKNEHTSRSRFYFTKESHLHTLINLVYASKLPTRIPYYKLGELDYLTHVTFEVYERKQSVFSNEESKFSLRLGFSSGSSCKNLMDIQVDSNHVLTIASRT